MLDVITKCEVYCLLNLQGLFIAQPPQVNQGQLF